MGLTSIRFCSNMCVMLYKLPWARIEADWPTTVITDHLEKSAHTDPGKADAYDQQVQSGHPTVQQHMFVDAAIALGLQDPYVLIHNQLPGQQMPLHTDFGSPKRFPDLSESQHRAQIERVFVFLDDWRPGQIVQMAGDTVPPWKRGDVLWFDWRLAEHGTANIGTKTRPSLLITGKASDRFWQIHRSQRLTTIKI